LQIFIFKYFNNKTNIYCIDYVRLKDYNYQNKIIIYNHKKLKNQGVIKNR